MTHTPADGAPQHQPLAEREWPGLDVAGAHILVAGFGVSGYAVVDQTLQRGAHVTAVDAATTEATRERAQILETLGARILLGPEHTAKLPSTEEGQDFDVVITSPGWKASQPLLTEARERGIPVWSEVELARRMQSVDGPAWLAVTGTNGKTTVVTMLESILQAAGLRAVAAGNVGLPVIEAVLDPAGMDVIALELSSFQLEWTEHVEAFASAIVNIGEDHVDWHGSLENYTHAKGLVYRGTRVACMYNKHDDLTLRELEEADVEEGCRAVGIGLDSPGPSDFGVVDDLLVDRAFVENRYHQAAQVADLGDLAHLGPHGAPSHMVFNALVAASLARAYGVDPVHVRDGLRAFRPGAHRSEIVAAHGDVVWVDDSKATNPAAASAALGAADSIVWIAGGDAKGARLDDLVARHAHRLRAVVLLGRDPAPFTSALEAHAPGVPVTWVDPSDVADPRELMRQAVTHAHRYAQQQEGRPTVALLAPAAASIDQFAHYAQRGSLFAEAAAALGDTHV